MDFVHKPVMLSEVLSYLAPTAPHSLLIDGNLGEGGHAHAFLSQFQDLRYCGLDADEGIQAKAKMRLMEFGSRMQFFHGWNNDFFSNYPLEDRPDRILFDLGISIYHYSESGRGFSFSKDEPLDMRLGDGETLAEALRRLDEGEIAQILFDYGEERYGHRISRAIKASAGNENLSSKALAEIIFNNVPADYRHGRIHPATRSFQALRIFVNGELERIKEAIQGAFSVLKVGGRMGVISFHSLEDRIIKNSFREFAKECHCPPEYVRCVCDRKPFAKLLNKKPLEAQSDELQNNPPSRSAKFRVLEKTKEMS